MYLPRHFDAPDEEAVAQILGLSNACDLVTATSEGLFCTYMPFIYTEPTEPGVSSGRGSLQGHVARANPHHSLKPVQDSLVIVHGPNGYISPSYYPSKAEHGRVVPTWNYVTLHVYGELIVHDDTQWVESLVRRLTDIHERRSERPWSVDDAPPNFIDAQLRAIVGLELRISRIEAKFKLSQNRTPVDAAGAIDGVRLTGNTTLSGAMAEVLAPELPPT